MSLGRDRNKEIRARKRRLRIRRRIQGRAERPRLTVHRSLRFMYAQIVDDETGRTLLGLSSRRLEPAPGGNKQAQSRALGKALAERARELGIEAVVLDRNRYPYHGRVRQFAEGAREGGLRF